VLIALAASFGLTLAGGEGADTPAGRLGGDYPAFYGAGRMAAAGDLDQLYEPERLVREQADLLPGEQPGGYFSFQYPPHVAVAYRPLAALPYRTSYAVHTALMVLLLVAAVQLVRPMLPAIDRAPLPATTLALAFFPLFRGITGGQNTALTLFLLAVSWRAVHDRRDWVAGIALGILLFKPQYGLPLLALHLVARRWRVLPGVAAMAALAWTASAAAAGTGWLGTWLDSVGAYPELEAKANATNAVSWLGATEALIDPGTAANAIGWSLAAITGAVVAWQWWRHKDADLAWPMAAASAALLLASPHAVFYDTGLIVLAGFVVLDRGDRRAQRSAALLWLAGFSHIASSALGVNPLVLVIASALVLSLRSGAGFGRQATRTSARSTP
jgi:hypothetical protein